MPTRTLAVLATTVLIGALLVPAAAGASPDDPDEPMVHVDLETNGDGTVSLINVYDLDDEAERAAFDSLQTDDDAKTEFRDQFLTRMESVAETAGEDSDVITDGSIDVRTTDDYGIVTLSVTWHDLADSDDETLTVSEPFASGFDTDRMVVLTGPDDSTIESTTHEPTTDDGSHLAFDTGTDLDGLEVALSLEETADGSDAQSNNADTATDGVPGFGIGFTLVAVIAGVGFASLRRKTTSGP